MSSPSVVVAWRQNKMFIYAESKSKKSSSECKRVHELIFISVLYVFRNPRRCALAANLYVRPLSRNALVCRQGEVNPLAEKIRIRHNRTSTRMNNDQSLSQLGLTSWSGVAHVSYRSDAYMERTMACRRLDDRPMPETYCYWQWRPPMRLW